MSRHVAPWSEVRKGHRPYVSTSTGKCTQLARVLLISLLGMLMLSSDAFATWAVIAVDRRTGQVVVASATCVPQARLEGFPAVDLRDIQAIVVPGKAVAVAQAGVDRTRANQRLIYRELQAGTLPATIIEMLREDPQIQRRQFAIVDLQGQAAAFSGASNGAESLHATGRVEDEQIFFTIVGNILASEAVVRKAVAAFRAAGGTVTDRVIAAMEAASAHGGDRRCTCETEPHPEAPCDGKTAHVAYVLAADPGDTVGESFNDGDYALYISITDQDIKPDENANPVTTLRLRYEAWKAAR